MRLIKKIIPSLLKLQHTTPVDSDTQEFIYATGITDRKKKLAIKQRVLHLKAAGIWNETIFKVH